MINLRRAVVLASFLAPLAVVTACSGGGGGGDDDTETATPTPTLTPTPTPTPRPQFALSFDGTNDYAAIPDGGGFDLGSSFTVEFWVKPDALPSAQFGYVAGVQGSDALITGISFAHAKSFANSVFSVSIPGTNSVSQPEILTVGTWAHLAGTYDGANIRFYKDGVIVGTPTAHAGTMSLVDMVFIGRGFGTGFFDGLIDEVRIWDTVRTDIQLTLFMHERLTGDEPGLVAYWDMDDGAGEFLLDRTQNQNHGRLGSTTAADASDPAWVASDVPVDE